MVDHMSSSSFRNRTSNTSNDVRFPASSLSPQLSSSTFSSFSTSFVRKSAVFLASLFLIFQLLSTRTNDDGPTLLLRIQRYTPPPANHVITSSSEGFADLDEQSRRGGGGGGGGVLSGDLRKLISATVFRDKQFIGGKVGSTTTPHDTLSESTNPLSIVKSISSSISISSSSSRSFPPQLVNRRVVILSHELSVTGAPRVCAELAQVLGNLGVDTTISTLSTLGSNKWLTRSDARIVANLLPSLSPNYFSFQTHRGPRDGSLSVLVENADVVVVSTAVIPSSDLVSRVASLDRSERRSNHLIWWIHESESVMTALGEEAINRALDALSTLGRVLNIADDDYDEQEGSRRIDQLRLGNTRETTTSDHREIIKKTHNSVVFPSRAAQEYWVISASRLPETKRMHALKAINAATVVMWGLPAWKLSSLRFQGQVAEFENERSRLRRELGIQKEDLVFLSLGTLHALKGHAGIVRAVRCASASFGRNTNGNGGGRGNIAVNEDGVNIPPRLILVAVGGGFCADHRHFPFSHCNGGRTTDSKGSLLVSPPAPCSDLKQQGDPEEEVDDMSWVMRDGESFHFLPAARRIEPYFAMADVVVSNTLGGGETWGLATLEAMGANLPVLAAARGGSLELIVDGETGLLHRDEVGLAENIKAVSLDAEFRKRLGAAAGKRAEETFGEEHIVDSVEVLFH